MVTLLRGEIPQAVSSQIQVKFTDSQPKLKTTTALGKTKMTSTLIPPLKFKLDPILTKVLSLHRMEYLVTDRELKIQEVSPALTKFTKDPQELEVGKDVRKAFPYLAGLEEVMIDVLSEKQSAFQIKGMSRKLENGEKLYWNLHILSEISTHYGLIVFFEDVSDMMSIKQMLVQAANDTNLSLTALTQAHNYITKIIDSIADVLLITNANGVIKKINHAAQALFGYKEHELIGKPLSIITGYEHLLRQFSELPEALKSDFSNEVKVWCHSKTGRKVFVAFSCSLIKTDREAAMLSSEILQDYVYVGRDITEQQRSKKRQNTQYAVARILSDAVDEKEANRKILQAICDNLEWDIGVLWSPYLEVHPEDKAERKYHFSHISNEPITTQLYCEEIWHTRHQDLSDQDWEYFVNQTSKMRFVPGEGLPGIVWSSCSARWVTNILQDPIFIRAEIASIAGLQTAFAFPIHNEGVVLSVMSFLCQEEQTPDYELLQMMNAIGNQLGQFFKRKQTERELQDAEAEIRALYQQEKQQRKELAQKNLALQEAQRELQRLVLIDGLTEIANRRHFDACLEQEWKRMIRENSELTLILCDIDYFKQYNDNYGHQAGDECIKAIAKILQNNTKRPADLAARYGGEEFAIILPNTNSQGGIKVAERVREDLKMMAIPHGRSQVSCFVTISLGIVSTIPRPSLSCHSLVEEADKALYQAKMAGRDRYVVVN